MIDKIFICYTRLHFDISKSIINQNKFQGDIFYFFDGEIESNRDTNYKSCHINLVSFQGWFLLFRMIVKIRFFRKQSIIYLGNPKKLISTLFVKLSGVSELNTFDDGIGHAIGKGYFYELDEVCIFKKLLLKILPSLSYSRLISKVKKHYTIFNIKNELSWGNVFDKEICNVKLDVRDNFETGINFTHEKKDLTILLGSVFFQDGHLTNDCELDLERDIINKFGVDIYLPHPRRNTRDLAHVNSIVFFPKKLSSESCISYLVNEGYRVTLLGVNSTGLLTISAYPNVKVVCIRTELISSNVYALFDSIGIEIIDL